MFVVFSRCNPFVSCLGSFFTLYAIHFLYKIRLIYIKMEIRDLSWNETITKRFNNPLLPRSIRGIIVGKSGCGKTTLLLNLLLRPGWLDYDNLCVFGRSLFQPKYRILKKAFEENLPKE